MEVEIQSAKVALRKKIRSGLKRLAPEHRASASANVRALLKQQPFWRQAASILFFAPLPDEADVWPLLEETLAGGKLAALPRYDAASNDYFACRVQNPQHEIEPGAFGIREPVATCPEIALERLGLILVPGIAFDGSGHRLGRGRGFYDRFLRGFQGVKCGIAFDEQVVDAVPTGNLDVRVDFVLTPTRCVKCDE